MAKDIIFVMQEALYVIAQVEKSTKKYKAYPTTHVIRNTPFLEADILRLLSINKDLTLDVVGTKMLLILCV
jgi:hypothetical protein